MSSGSNTRHQQGSGRGGGAEMDAAGRAAELVREADEVLLEFAKPGRWPQARTVQRFKEAERLETVLARYSTAMKLDPTEPACPWNLASSLHRLGYSEIALSFIERAISLAREAGEDEWADAGAHLAWADMAVTAGHYDAALLALARANALAPDSPSVRSTIRSPRREIPRRLKRPNPEHELAEQLEALAS